MFPSLYLSVDEASRGSGRFAAPLRLPIDFRPDKAQRCLVQSLVGSPRVPFLPCATIQPFPLLAVDAEPLALAPKQKITETGRP